MATMASKVRTKKFWNRIGTELEMQQVGEKTFGEFFLQDTSFQLLPRLAKGISPVVGEQKISVW